MLREQILSIWPHKHVVSFKVHGKSPRPQNLFLENCKRRESIPGLSGRFASFCEWKGKVAESVTAKALWLFFLWHMDVTEGILERIYPLHVVHGKGTWTISRSLFTVLLFLWRSAAYRQNELHARGHTSSRFTLSETTIGQQWTVRKNVYKNEHHKNKRWKNKSK